MHECSSALSKLLETFDHDMSLVLQPVKILLVTIVIVDSVEMTVVQLASPDDSIQKIVSAENVVMNLP
jgi:hypothetical protein